MKWRLVWVSLLAGCYISGCVSTVFMDCIHDVIFIQHRNKKIIYTYIYFGLDNFTWHECVCSWQTEPWQRVWIHQKTVCDADLLQRACLMLRVYFNQRFWITALAWPDEDMLVICSCC